MKLRTLPLALLVGLIGGCSLSGTGPARPTLTPENNPAPGVRFTPSPIPTPCPPSVGDEIRYGGAEGGFCFLFPSSFYVYPSKAIILRTLPTTSETSSNGGAMTITFEDLQGKSIQDYADEIIAQNSAGGSPSKTEITLEKGYPAFLLDGFAGPPPWRALLLGHAGKAYLISFQPWDNSLPTIQADLQQIFETVVSSWTFTS